MGAGDAKKSDKDWGGARWPSRVLKEDKLLWEQKVAYGSKKKN